MTKRISAAQAKAHLSELMAQVAYGGEHYVIERRGKPLAALVSVDDLERLEQGRATSAPSGRTWPSRLPSCPRARSCPPSPAVLGGVEHAAAPVDDVLLRLPVALRLSDRPRMVRFRSHGYA